MALSPSLITHELLEDASTELSCTKNQVEATLKLIIDDCTVPFIARYRKEMTGGLDEVQIRRIKDAFEYSISLNERKETILKSIDEQKKLTPELRAKILSCKNRNLLEDLYLPYKPKKRTRGQIAKELGLEPLAITIYMQSPELQDLTSECMKFVDTHENLKTLDQVLQGAKDYIAEVVAENAELKKELRGWMYENSIYRAAVKEEFKDKKTKYNNYFDFSEPVKTIAAHRLMALRRGEKEEILNINIEFDEDTALSIISSSTIQATASAQVKSFLTEVVKDSFKRLLRPSLETELRLETKTIAEENAIQVFSKNLRNLLLLPPIPRKIVMGVDPGIRTGSKCVVCDQTGKLLEYLTIYPDHESSFDTPKNLAACEKIIHLFTKHKVEYVSVGNGTAGREMEDFIEKCIAKFSGQKPDLVMVNESGASVYSASDVAREEFPDLDITYRGSVSIARRLQDPLAELVKIDPKSIGVGQYQHDVNQNRLKKSLEEVVESCVNFVGVNLNTASPSLLSYVAGIGPTLAKNVVKFREQHGEFKSRQELFEVMGFGPKTFEQAAGFLKIPGGINPLDNTGVHPEAYNVVEKIVQDLNSTVTGLVGNKQVLTTLKLEKYATPEIGLPSLQDIVKEMLKPGRDPREKGTKQTYSREVRDFSHLKEGQILTGTVTNVTNFGAFVDIGVHQDGLVHISELSNEFIKDASLAIQVGAQVKVMVIAVDKDRKRISLSKRAAETGINPNDVKVKTPENTQQNSTLKRTFPNQRDNRKPFTPAGASQQFPQGRAPGRNNIPKESKANQQPATLQDLLSKFNVR
jgi:protein Tex